MMLREISILWSLVHTLVMFVLLFQPRYSRKTTVTVILATMIPLIAVNTALAFFIDADRMGTLLLLTLTLPSLVVFWILAKNRDGRFFFTFCLVDTVSLEVIFITQILDYYVSPKTHLLMFLVRLFAFPLIEWFLHRKLRETYHEVQRRTQRGWTDYAILGAIFYVLMTLMMTVPNSITERPEYLPAMALVFLLIPRIYANIISTLRRQQRMYEMKEQENILRLQVHNMTSRVDDLSVADERFRQERHNLRLKMRVIANLVETKRYEELGILMEEYMDTIQKTHIRRYCKNAVIDAALSAFIRNAENRGIRLDLGFDFPDPIPVDPTELATVLANAIENAINACEKMQGGDRYIEIKVLSDPSFMIKVSNSYEGTVEFDEKEIPQNREDGHGFGTRSIVAFCNKHGAFYRFLAKDGVFTLYLNF